MKRILSLMLLLLFIPFAHASIFEDIDHIEVKVQDFLEDRDPVVIEGQYSTITQKRGYDYFKTKFTDINNAKYTTESTVSERELAARDTIVLLGGPYQNKYTKKYLEDTSYTRDDEIASVAAVIFLTRRNERILIFTEKTALNNLARVSLDKSPLAQFVPRELIPAAATGAGLLALGLWNILLAMLSEVFRSKLSEKILSKIRKTKIEKHFKGFSVKGIQFKAREWGTILLAALIFALSLSYMYLAPDMKAISFFAMVAALNIGIGTISHMARLLLDKWAGLHTEYTLWKTGAVLTALTSWLGNTFSLAGYIRTEHTEDLKKEGKVAYLTNVVTFLIFVSAYIANHQNPQIWLQMTSLLALAAVFIQMLPLHPYEGKAIYAWNRKVWIMTMGPLCILYIIVHLVV